MSRLPLPADFDVLVVGTGASAVHATLPLARAGWRVGIVDVGRQDESYRGALRPEPFLEIRRGDPEQHRVFLGDGFEGVPLGPVRVGAQLTPPRQYLARGGDGLAPLRAGGFQAMQSFALGGLGAGWGASCMPFTDRDMAAWPIGRADLQEHYDAVVREVGVCGDPRDDLAPELGPLRGLLPPARVDSNGESILARYARHRGRLRARGLVAGHARLALATARHDGRGPCRYLDTEFWGDPDGSVYRPAYTVGKLAAMDNVTLVRGWLALRFEETGDGVILEGVDLDSGRGETLRARRLVLAAGTLGTARIVARSLGLYHAHLPLASNPYTYYPCLNAARLGRPARDRRHSLTQVTMLFDAGDRILQPQAYSYRSLLLFKLVKEAPLPHREALRLLRNFAEYFVIVGVFHPDTPGAGKSLVLRRAEDPRHDPMEVHYRPGAGEWAARSVAERRLLRVLWPLGLLPLRAIHPGEGASIHYAGPVAMGGPLADAACRLGRAPRVRVADGAAFPDLPSKGLTLTLMANARRVAVDLDRELRSG